MLQTQEELLSVLTQNGIECTNQEQLAVYTVEEADKQHKGIDGAHSKFFLKKIKR